MLIGITGQIGTGKSEVAEILKKYGAFVISADKIGFDVVEGNPAIIKRLIRVFGDDIVTKSGRLRRKKLARLAFSSETNKRKLNQIVHPALLKSLGQQVRSALKKYNLVVVDAALLVDWAWHKKVDLTILVHAGKNIKFARLLKKGFTREEAIMRLRSQLKYSCLREHSDMVIFNNKTKKHLEKRVQIILKSYLKSVDNYS
jgi:dephospho-CoA kinase